MKIANIKSKTDLSGFYIVFKGSTLIEQEHERGISHLIEHLVCKSYDDLDATFTKYGLTCNAYTSTSNIVYYLTGLDEYVEMFKLEYFDRILNKFDITEEILEKEKKIVSEEYFNSFSTGLEGHYSNTIRKYFNHFSPIGDIDVIQNVTLEQVYDLYKRQYTQPEMVINVSKNFEKFNTTHFNKYFTIKESNLKLIDAIFRLNSDYKHQDYPFNAESTTILNIGSKINIDDKPFVSFINKMLSADLKKPLYKTIREDNGLCYYVAMSAIDFNETLYPIFYTECTNDNVDKINELFTEIISNPDKYLTEEIFDDVLLYFKIKSKVRNVNIHDNVDHYFEKSIYSEGCLDNLTYDSVMKFYKENYLDVLNKFTFTKDK